jgi:hypothetical protein
MNMFGARAPATGGDVGYRLRSLTNRAAPAGAAFVAVVLLIGGLDPDNSLRAFGVCVVLAAIVSAYGLRMYLGGVVKISNTEVLVRGSTRSRNFPIEYVSRFEVAEPHGNTKPVASDRLRVVFSDGTTWRPPDFASSPKRRSSPGSVVWIADAANTELARRRGVVDLRDEVVVQ